MAAYGTDAGFQAWLLGNGFALPPTAPSPAVLRLKGSVYVDGLYGSQLSCSRPAGGFEQERAWPRIGAKAGKEEIPEDVIPEAWVRAAYRAAWLEAETPGWTSGTFNPARRVKSQRVGEISREFFDSAKAAAGGPTAASNIDADIAAWVGPFLCAKASPWSHQVARR